MFNFLTRMLKTYPKISGVGIGLVLFVSLIATAEVILSFTTRSIYDREFPDPYKTHNRVGVHHAVPGQHHSAKTNTVTGESIYDAIYTIDQHGRRVTEVPYPADRDRFIVFLGGSFTYGEGVQDHETLPYRVGFEASHYLPYNYGFHGLGPFDLMAQVEDSSFGEHIKPRQGIFIYTFIDQHVLRTVGSMRIISWKKAGVYYEQNQAGEFTRNGSFLSGRKITTLWYRILEKSSLLAAFNIDLPWRIQDSHLKLTAGAIHYIQTQLAEKYADAKFYVLIFPGSTLAQRLTPLLDQHQVRYLDYSNLVNFTDSSGPYRMSGDSHPSSLAYQAVATQLVQDLNLNP